MLDTAEFVENVTKMYVYFVPQLSTAKVQKVKLFGLGSAWFARESQSQAEDRASTHVPELMKRRTQPKVFDLLKIYFVMNTELQGKIKGKKKRKKNTPKKKSKEKSQGERGKDEGIRIWC